jgi:hypothetical protein
MALFALWKQAGDMPPVDRLHAALLAEAHLVPQHVVADCLSNRAGAWNIAAFITASRYYAVDDQVWRDPSGHGACLIHGLVWREDGGKPHVLNAASIACLLPHPGAMLPPDICGEYVVARVHACGTLEAFSDPAGLHHLFHDRDRPGIIANRAGLIATLRDDWRTDPMCGLWLATIGYRVGTSTSYRAVAQIPAGFRLTIDQEGQHLDALADPVIAFPEHRGFTNLAADAFDLGLSQAKAAILLATDGQDPVFLPITGGKDSRAVLALCLAAGLRDRLVLFTRGYDEHVDVIAGRAIASALRLRHERQPPLGSDLTAHWSAATFIDNLAAQAYQTDGMMGGWDFILGRTVGVDTLVTGHMGEVLKAYSKRTLPAGQLDPVTMVRLQAPFDPLGLLRPDTRDRLCSQLSSQMTEAEAAGATPADQPDIFYYRNRVPNWLGGIRGIKSFERQPVMPLGVPALMRLAFTLSPQDRKVERAHFEVIRRCAPELINLPFALQRWDAQLRTEEYPAFPEPILPGNTAPPVFGNWQYSLNHVPRLRGALLDILSGPALGLWGDIDRDVVLERLRHRTFEYFDGISLLGLIAAVFHEARIVAPLKLDAAAPVVVDTRPIAPAMRRHLAGEPWSVPTVTIHGHLDAVCTPELPDAPTLLHGWVHAPSFPGARIAVEAHIGDKLVASAVAERPRPDLVRAGLDDGAHGFTLAVSADFAPKTTPYAIVVTAFDTDGFVPIGGRVEPDQ